MQRTGAESHGRRVTTSSLRRSRLLARRRSLAACAWAMALLPACATLDPGRRSSALEDDRLDTLEQYAVDRAQLAARQERDHARMELQHAAEVAALDAALVTALNTSGRDLRELEAQLAAERRVFLADARARLRLIDARVRQLVDVLDVDDSVLNELEELGARRAAIEVGLHALDFVENSSWLEAQRVVSREIGSLAQSVEELDDHARLEASASTRERPQ